MDIVGSFRQNPEIIKVFHKKNKQSKRYTTIKFCHLNNSKWKDLTVLLKIGLSRAVNKLFLISRLILLESLDKRE